MQYNLVVEKFSGHDQSGKVGKISKKQGDDVVQGETLFVIESEKGTLQYKSKYTGKLEKLDISEGMTINKGQVIGVVVGETGQAVEKKSAVNIEGISVGKPKKNTYQFGIAMPEKKNYEVDVAIVGGGPGGYVAGIRAAQNGSTVLIIEEDRLGGTCLNWGCIPTKAMVQSTEVLEKVKEAHSFGIEVKDFQISMEKILQRKNQVVDTLVAGIEYLMDKNEITYVKGKAVVEDSKTLRVKNKEIDATIAFQKLIVATGAKPIILPIDGAVEGEILTSKDLLTLNEIPKSLTIIGGGVIGMEFAFIYQALGTKVQVVEYSPQILGLLDADVAAVVKEAAIERGINIYEKTGAKRIETTLDGQKVIVVEQEGKETYLISEKVAMATGRKANVEALDLDKLGVSLNERKNGIAVDSFMRTSNPDIYAIGDVTNLIQLAHVASHQGIIAADQIHGVENTVSYDQVPSAIFTVPEVGHVGLTEKEALGRDLDIKVGKFPFAANGKAQAMGETAGFVKLIADTTSKKIIGGTIVGPHATDMISTVGNIIHSGMTFDEAVHVIYSHPTLAESIHEALLSIDERGIHFG